MGDSTTVQPVQNIAGDADSTRQADPSLSLIVPAYNEAARIDATIREAVAWLGAQPFATELIVVDDGSDDPTADLAESALSELGSGQLVRIDHGGKAAAVRAGMLAASCDQIAFTDADLATPRQPRSAQPSSWASQPFAEPPRPWMKTTQGPVPPVSS